MAYVSQSLKAELAPRIKAICKKYGIKASLSVRNHMTLCLTVQSGPIDFIKNYNEVAGNNNRNSNSFYKAEKSIDVNVYWYKSHFSGKALKFIDEVYSAMMVGNHDNSDIQTDYFDIGWYVDINIGKWNKPYQLV